MSDYDNGDYDDVDYAADLLNKELRSGKRDRLDDYAGITIGREKLNFQSVAGPHDQNQSVSLGEFIKTKNGSKLYTRLKELEDQVDPTLKAWTNAENILRKFQNEPKNPYYHIDDTVELNRLGEEVFEAKVKHEKVLMDRQQTWYRIEVVLQSWNKIRKYPQMILDCKKQLEPLKKELVQAKRFNLFEKCLELQDQITHLEDCIESWTHNWKVTTGSPLPTVPRQFLGSPPKQKYKPGKRKPRKKTSVLHQSFLDVNGTLYNVLTVKKMIQCLSFQIRIDQFTATTAMLNVN
jgi:hypothetical protein